MGKIKVFPTPDYRSKQPSDPVVPKLPSTGILLGPSKSGKTVALISMILEQYRGCFERIYIFSPSINVDDGWRPVKQYIEETMKAPTDRQIIRQHRKRNQLEKDSLLEELTAVLPKRDLTVSCTSTC